MDTIYSLIAVVPVADYTIPGMNVVTGLGNAARVAVVTIAGLAFIVGLVIWFVTKGAAGRAAMVGVGIMVSSIAAIVLAAAWPVLAVWFDGIGGAVR